MNEGEKNEGRSVKNKAKFLTGFTPLEITTDKATGGEFKDGRKMEKFITQKSKAKFLTGFTLLEMTVVLAIVAVMTAIVLMNLPKMKGGLSIDVVAQEVAIYIRGAQVYSRATKGAGGENFNSYGLRLAVNSASFFLWADQNGTVDKNDDFIYNPPGGDDGIEGDGMPQETYVLPQGFYLSSLVCDENYLEWVDIVYRLPDPEAEFGSIDDVCAKANYVGVCLTSPNLEQYRLIKAFNNGQIMVENPTMLADNPCVSAVE